MQYRFVERSSWLVNLLLLLAAASTVGCAPAHSVLIEGRGFEAHADGCGGYFEDTQGHGSFRTESCETVAVFWRDSACDKFGPSCSDALRALSTDGDAGYLDGFGLLDRVAGRPGLYRVEDGYIRVRDEAKFRSEFRAFTPSTEVIGMVLRHEVHGGSWLSLVKRFREAASFQAGVRAAVDAKVRELASYEVGQRVIADFWHVAELLTLVHAAELAGQATEEHTREAKRHHARLGQSYGDLAAYLEDWRTSAEVIDFVRATRPYVRRGLPGALREEAPGAVGFGAYLHTALGGLVERDRAADLLEYATSQEARRPATAEALRAYAQLLTPMLVTGADRAVASLCRRNNNDRFLWLGGRHVTHIDYPRPLETPTIEIPAPSFASRQETRKVGERTQRVLLVEAGSGLSPEQQREAERLRIELELLERERAAYFAPSASSARVDLSSPQRPVVTGWSCDAVNRNCGPTYQMGTAPTSPGSAASGPANSLRDDPYASRIDALREELERVAPAHLTAEAVYGDRTEDVTRQVTVEKASYELVVQGFGDRATVAATGDWYDAREVAKADAVCNGLVRAAERARTMTATALAGRLAAARARANASDPVEQRAIAITEVSRDRLRELLLLALGDAPTLDESPWVIAKRFTHRKQEAEYAKYVGRERRTLDMDPEHWIDWYQGSWTLGYGATTGRLPREGASGVLGTKLKQASPWGTGKYLDAQLTHGFERPVAHHGGQLRVGAGDLSGGERWLYEIGLVGSYTRAGNSALYVAGIDTSVQWRMFRQVSLQLGVTWNALSLADVAEEVPIPGTDPDVQTGEYDVTSTAHPMWLQLHWLMPSQLHLTLGLRGDAGGDLDTAAFASFGYTFGFSRF